MYHWKVNRILYNHTQTYSAKTIQIYIYKKENPKTGLIHTEIRKGTSKHVHNNIIGVQLPTNLRIYEYPIIEYKKKKKKKHKSMKKKKKN